MVLLCACVKRVFKTIHWKWPWVFISQHLLVRISFFSWLKSIFTCDQSTPWTFVLWMQNYESTTRFFCIFFLLLIFTYSLLKIETFQYKTNDNGIKTRTLFKYRIWQLRSFWSTMPDRHIRTLYIVYIKQTFYELYTFSFIAFIYLMHFSHSTVQCVSLEVYTQQNTFVVFCTKIISNC